MSAKITLRTHRPQSRAVNEVSSYRERRHVLLLGRSRRTSVKPLQHRICQSIDSSFDEHLDSPGVRKGVLNGQFARLQIARSSLSRHGRRTQAGRTLEPTTLPIVQIC